MIVARSPLRLPLGGGGTDLPSYSSRHGGRFVAAAIDRGVDVTVRRVAGSGVVLRRLGPDATTEVRADGLDDLGDPLVREALRLTETPIAGLEITSSSSVPSGVGLGSSGSFTTALIAALVGLRGETLAPEALADAACRVEIDMVGAPVGIQDQHAAALGGVRAFRVHPDGRIDHRRIDLAPGAAERIETALVLYDTGLRRRAGDVLVDQEERTRAGDPSILENLHRTKEIGARCERAVEQGDVEGLGALLHEHWTTKRRRSPGMTDDRIDRWYATARAAGALGGKLVGAGGGGCLLLLTTDADRLRASLAGSGLVEVPFRFSPEGTRIVGTDVPDPAP